MTMMSVATRITGARKRAPMKSPAAPAVMSARVTPVSFPLPLHRDPPAAKKSRLAPFCEVAFGAARIAVRRRVAAWAG